MIITKGSYLFKKGYCLTAKGDKKKKLEILFNMYDFDSSGLISKEELKQVIKGVLKLQDTELNEKGINKMVNDTFKTSDTSKDGQISKSK